VRKVYVYRVAPVGYGPRIFVPHEHTQALDAVFKALSTWGGHDKDTGLAWGYEFPSSEPERLAAALWEAESKGFVLEDATSDNAKEFWP
jgi:hypothetical protein